MDNGALLSTNFLLPGQTGIYRGKVRDVYMINEDRIVSVATDRLSAFDVVLERPIPHKGQVLNQLAAYFLEATADIVPNWLQAVPDPNVSVGYKAEPIKAEIIVRGVLVGHAWREYQAGRHSIAGIKMPDGLQEYDAFIEPIITPTSKAEAGHDEDVTAEELINGGLISQMEWQKLSEYSLRLFAKGREMARARGLVLADTKYEFGKLNGKVFLIDEVHTPDSSRYFYADSYDRYIAGDKTTPPKHLSKEFVRERLMNDGFSGQSDQPLPELSDEFISEISERYIELYETLTGLEFVKPDTADISQRIESNLINYLEKAHATA